MTDQEGVFIKKAKTTTELPDRQNPNDKPSTSGLPDSLTVGKCIELTIQDLNSQLYGELAKVQEVNELMVEDSSGVISEKTSKEVQEASSTVDKQHTCEICLNDTVEFFELSCGHEACVPCYGQYIRTVINNGQCFIKCIGTGCSMLVEDSDIIRMVPDLEHKYMLIVMEQYFKNKEGLTTCSFCGRILKILDKKCTYFTCPCHMDICRECLSPYHCPVNCATWKTWSQISITDDEHTASWMKLNAKKCPNCNTLIQKNGGCMSILCKCGLKFCWNCFERWDTHQKEKCMKSGIEGERIQTLNADFKVRFLKSKTKFNELLHESQFLYEAILSLSQQTDEELHPQLENIYFSIRRIMMYTAYSYVQLTFLKDNGQRNVSEFYLIQMENQLARVKEILYQSPNIQQLSSASEQCKMERDKLERHMKFVAELIQKEKEELDRQSEPGMDIQTPPEETGDSDVAGNANQTDELDEQALP